MFDGRGPAAYVQYLTRPGLGTALGPVPLTAYVSTRARSPNAAALGDLLTRLVSSFRDSSLDALGDARHVRAFSPRRWTGELPTRMDDPMAASLSRLGMLHDSIGGVRDPDAWRSVFSGQGMPQDVIGVMNFVARDAPMMLAACGRSHALRHYFEGGSPSLSGLRQMVADEVFGLDCLGLVGTYLAWCGAESRYQRLSQAQYESVLGWRRLGNLTEVEDRCVLLWLNTGTHHIAIIDRVVSREDGSVYIDLCQSSRGGPQVNTGVRLTRSAGPYFKVHGGDPPSPVSGDEILVIKRPQW
jgi:hypothetical protein